MNVLSKKDRRDYEKYDKDLSNALNEGSQHRINYRQNRKDLFMCEMEDKYGEAAYNTGLNDDCLEDESKGSLLFIVFIAGILALAGFAFKSDCLNSNIVGCLVQQVSTNK